MLRERGSSLFFHTDRKTLGIGEVVIDEAERQTEHNHCTHDQSMDQSRSTGVEGGREGDEWYLD